MNNKQKLRYFVNIYGNELWIDDLYSKMKEKVWKIKKSWEMPDKKIETLTEIYNLWIKGLESWDLDYQEAKTHIIRQIA